MCAGSFLNLILFTLGLYFLLKWIYSDNYFKNKLKNNPMFRSNKDINKGKYTVDDLYNKEKKNKEDEINRILDKINSKGYNSLTKKEKSFLKSNN